MKISKLTQSTPKLIVHGINETIQLSELIQLGKNFQIKNFDIARMNNEGIITLIFAVYQEALDFGKFLENEKGYQVELTLIRELYEIPETDENEKNQNFVKVDGQCCNSDGQRHMGLILQGDEAQPNNSFNR